MDVKDFIRKFDIANIEELQEVLGELSLAIEIFENFGFFNEVEAAKGLAFELDSIIQESLLFEEE